MLVLGHAFASLVKTRLKQKEIFRLEETPCNVYAIYYEAHMQLYWGLYGELKCQILLFESITLNLKKNVSSFKLGSSLTR